MIIDQQVINECVQSEFYFKIASDIKTLFNFPRTQNVIEEFNGYFRNCRESRAFIHSCQLNHETENNHSKM